MILPQKEVKLYRYAGLGFIWGILWAVFMEFTPIGWYISTRLTAVGVVIGNLGLILITWLAYGQQVALLLLAINVTSGIPVFWRMIYHLLWDNEDLKDRL